MNVLAIGSHPDDIEFGCGGTIRRLADRGHRVFLLILTDGGVGGDPFVRRREQLRSAKCLGASQVFWGGFSDTRLPGHEEVIEGVETIAKKVKPAFAFVHYGKDTHQDHRHVHESAVVATRGIPNVLFYEGPTTFDFAPNVYVNIGEQIASKVKSLNCHKSQVMRTNVNSQSILDIAKATAIFRGTQCRVPYAEAFSSLRMFILP